MASTGGAVSVKSSGCEDGGGAVQTGLRWGVLARGDSNGTGSGLSIFG